MREGLSENKSGIYIVTNIKNDKVYINCSTNVHRSTMILSRKLESNICKIKRLQNDWNKFGKDAFEFDVLERVESTDMLQRRKDAWIREYKSNDFKYGYNMEEIIKDEWEHERRERWSDEERWIDGAAQFQNVIKSVKNKLKNNTSKYSDSKLDCLRELNEEAENINSSINKYLSSQGYIEKQVKNSTDFLSEDDPFSQALSDIAYELLTPQFKNKQHQDAFTMDFTRKVKDNYFRNNIYNNRSEKIKEVERYYGYPHITKNKYMTDSKRYIPLNSIVKHYAKQNNINLNDLDVDDRIDLQERLLQQYNSINIKVNKNNKSYFHVETFDTYYDVKKEDFEVYPELKQMFDFKQNLHNRLGYGRTDEEKQSAKDKIIEEYIKKVKNISKDKISEFNFNRYYSTMKRTYSEVSSEIKTIKQLLLAPISFKRLGTTSIVLDWESDTGYYAENYLPLEILKANKEYGNLVPFEKSVWIEVPNTKSKKYISHKINFKNPIHIYGLLTSYASLKLTFGNKPDTQMWIILTVFEEVLQRSGTRLNKEEMYVLKLILPESTHDIDYDWLQKQYALKYGNRLNQSSNQSLRNLVEKTIPEKLSEVFKDWYDEYLFIRGKYTKKQCTGDCKELKIVSERYYRKRSDGKGKDGFYNKCRKCENNDKKKKNNKSKKYKNDEKV